MTDRVLAGVGGLVVVVTVLALTASGSVGASTPSSACPAVAPHANETGAANVSMDLLVGPRDAMEELDESAAIRRAIENGTLTEPGRRYDEYDVSMRDLLVYRIRLDGSAAGVFHALPNPRPSNRTTANESASNKTSGNETTTTGEPSNETAANVTYAEVFRWHEDDEGISLELMGETACAPDVNLSDSLQTGALALAADRANQTLYAVLDPRRAVLDDPGMAAFFEGGGHAQFEIAERNQYVSERYSAWVSYDRGEPRVEFNTTRGVFRFAAADNQTVRGTTNLRQGTRLDVTVTGTARASFTRRTTTTVREGGSFTATVDLSGVPANATAAVTAEKDPNARAFATVGNARVASVRLDGPVRQYGAVYELDVADIVLSNGGFVVIRNETTSWRANGTIVWASDYISPGREDYMGVSLSSLPANETNLVAVPYRDVDRNGQFNRTVDVPYLVNGTSLTAYGDETLATDSGESNATENTTARTDRNVSSTTTVPPGSPTSARTGTTTGTGAGFGLLVALVALLVVVPLTRR